MFGRLGLLLVALPVVSALRILLPKAKGQGGGVAGPGGVHWTHAKTSVGSAKSTREVSLLAGLESNYAVSDAAADALNKEEFKVSLTWYEAEVAVLMQPWRKQKRAKAHRGSGYLFFDTDPGGFNNIRMSFEYFIDIAKRSNRTLVLPPPEGWYLVDWGPTRSHSAKYEGKDWIEGNGRSAYSDFFDIESLRSEVDVMTAQEFFDLEHKRLKIPADAEPAIQSNNQPDPNRWKLWLSHRAELARNPSLTQGSQFFSTAKGINMTWMNELCRIPRETAVGDMDLVHIPAYLWDHDQSTHRLMKNEASELRYLWCQVNETGRVPLHYRANLYNQASGPIGTLGLQNYLALHLRRNDFQFKQAPEDPTKLVEQIHQVALPQEAVYLASDEVDQTWWDRFRVALEEKGHKLWTFKDFEPDLSRRGHKQKYSGIVEMIICAGARDFHGTRMSTFTEGIQLLREGLARDHGDWEEHGYMPNRSWMKY